MDPCQCWTQFLDYIFLLTVVPIFLFFQLPSQCPRQLHSFWLRMVPRSQRLVHDSFISLSTASSCPTTSSWPTLGSRSLEQISSPVMDFSLTSRGTDYYVLPSLLCRCPGPKSLAISRRSSSKILLPSNHQPTAFIIQFPLPGPRSLLERVLSLVINLPWLKRSSRTCSLWG